MFFFLNMNFFYQNIFVKTRSIEMPSKIAFIPFKKSFSSLAQYIVGRPKVSNFKTIFSTSESLFKS